MTEHFSYREVRCKCCADLPPDPDALEETAEMMEAIRSLLGEPIHIHSWYRCPRHNKAVGGAPDSEHKNGRAVDFTVKGKSPRQVQEILKHYQGEGRLIGGLGSYPGFTHVDTGRPRRWKG